MSHYMEPTATKAANSYWNNCGLDVELSGDFFTERQVKIVKEKFVLAFIEGAIYQCNQRVREAERRTKIVESLAGGGTELGPRDEA